LCLVQKVFYVAKFFALFGKKFFFTKTYTFYPPPPPPPRRKSGLKLVCNVTIVYGNLKSENSQDHAQKPQRNCTFMNTASGLDLFFSAEGHGCRAFGNNICGTCFSAFRQHIQETVWPYYIGLKAVSYDRPWSGHLPLYVLIFYFSLNFLLQFKVLGYLTYKNPLILWKMICKLARAVLFHEKSLKGLLKSSS
jgi:hypothetical protein